MNGSLGRRYARALLDLAREQGALAAAGDELARAAETFGKPDLRGVVLLLDSRCEPSPDDRAMLDFLAELEIPTLVAITKMDKFGPKSGDERAEQLRGALALDEEQVVPVSARTGAGRDELATAIVELLRLPAWRAR